MVMRGTLYRRYTNASPDDGIDADAIKATDADGNPVQLPKEAVPNGVPEDGNTGQYLRKKSDTTQDTEWSDLPVSSPTVAGLLPTGGTQGQVPTRQAGGAVAWADQESGGGTGDITGVTAGDGLRGGGTTGTVELDVINPATKRLVDFEKHGLTGDGQTQQTGLIAQHLGDEPNASQLEGYNYTTFYDLSPRYTNQWAGIRIPLADKDNVNLYEVYVSESDGSGRFALFEGNTWTHVVDSGGYARYKLQIPDKPADQGLSVWRYQKLGIDGEQVDINYLELSNLPNIQDGRELFNGALAAVVITSLDAPSAVAVTNLTESLNVTTEPHGVLLAVFSPVLSGFAASDVAYSAPEYTGETSIDSVARAPIYLSTTSDLGRQVVLGDILKGTTLAGSDVVKLARHANGDTLLTRQYIPHQGHSLKDSGNAAGQFELAVLGFGAPRGLGSGTAFVFDTLPDAADFVDGDRIWVTGSANQGGYVKESTETHVPADTGLGGLTLNPSSDLVSTDDGVYDVDRYNRVTFTGPGGGTIAVDTTGWNDAPAALDYIYLSYRSGTRDNGSLVIHYSSNRTYTGAIVVRAGSHVVRMNGPGVGQATDEWRYDGLDLATVAALRENNWAFSEPDMTGYTVTHSLKKVLAGADTVPAKPTVTEHTWVGSPSIAIAANDTFTAWTDLQTLTLTEGSHDIWFDLHLSRVAPDSGTSFLGVDLRLQKGGADVWTTAATERINMRGAQVTGDRAIKELVQIDGDGAHVLQVRLIADSASNVNPVQFNADEQKVTIRTYP